MTRWPKPQSLMFLALQFGSQLALVLEVFSEASDSALLYCPRGADKAKLERKNIQVICRRQAFFYDFASFFAKFAASR